MSDNIEITLLPSGVGDKHTNTSNDICVSFNVKSDNIKVFPSSWRGVNFIRDGQGKIIPENAVVQFNPEATLNTEYNLTHSAGGIKTYIETLDEIDTTNHIFDLDFFLNGYHFEIFSLNLKYIYSSNLNLWACIRVDDLSIGDADLDDTKVLMPYYWNALNTPIPLDATLQDAYLIDQTDKVFGDILGELQYKNDGANIVTADMSNHCIFTGLVLTTVNPEADNSANIHTIQLFRNGQACYDNFYPRQVRSGRPDGKSTVIGDEGLIASYANMLAVGAFNAEDELANGEKPLFVVGNGTDDTQRRNAFEVFGKTENGKFSQTVKFGNITFKHNDTITTNQSDMFGLRNINDGIQVTDDGRSLTVNQNRISNTDIGIHSYGNIDLRGPDNGTGSKLRFQDYDANNPSIIKTISDFQIVEVATGKSNVIDPDARGLKMTNIHEINEKALVFKPCNAGIDRNKLRSINDGSIGIDDDAMNLYQHSIEIGRNRTDESAALSLAGDKLVVKSEPGKGEFINNIRIAEKNDSNTDNLFNVAGIYNKNDTAAPAIYFDNNKIEITPADSSHNTGTVNSLGANLRKILLDAIYPIGSIYMSMENRNPSQTLGGEWERISEGRVLLGAGDWTTGKKDNDTISGESKSKLLNTLKANGALPNTFVAKAEGGQYSLQIPKHTHNVPINHTIYSSDLKTNSFAFTNSSVQSKETNIAIPKHTHAIQASNDSKHHHTIPTVNSACTSADYKSHPSAVANLGWSDAVDSGQTLYKKYTKNRNFGDQEIPSDNSRTDRYQKMLLDIVGSSPIPVVSSGEWSAYNTHLAWNWNPTLADNAVKTGYFGMAKTHDKQNDATNNVVLMPWEDDFAGWYKTAQDRDKTTAADMWNSSFVSYVHRLFNTTLAVTCQFNKSKHGTGNHGGVDEYANDKYISRYKSKKGFLYFYIPTEVAWARASDITADMSAEDASLFTIHTNNSVMVKYKDDQNVEQSRNAVQTKTVSDIKFWENRFLKLDCKSDEVEESPVLAIYTYNTAPFCGDPTTSSVSSYMYVQFKYKKYDVGLCDSSGENYATINNHEAGHLAHRMLANDYELDKRIIYCDFVRDVFDALDHSKTFYRPDGEHTHNCVSDGYYSSNHKHEIITSDFAHTHNLQDVELDFNATSNETTMPSRYTNLPDVGSNLPPYLVCYMWQRIS